MIFKVSITVVPGKAVNSRGRTREDITSSVCFMLVGRKRDYEIKKRVIKLRGLDLTQVLKQKKIRTSSSLTIQKKLAPYKQLAKHNIQCHQLGTS